MQGKEFILKSVGLSPYLHQTRWRQPIIAMWIHWAMYDKRLSWLEQFKFAQSTAVTPMQGVSRA